MDYKSIVKKIGGSKVVVSKGISINPLEISSAVEVVVVDEENEYKELVGVLGFKSVSHLEGQEG